MNKPIALILLIAALAGCTEICPNGAPDVDIPLLCQRGDLGFVLPGIDFLPLDHVKLTNKEVQRRFAILGTYDSLLTRDAVVACNSYVTASECDLALSVLDFAAAEVRHPEGDESSRTGFTPFTAILDLHLASTIQVAPKLGGLRKPPPCRTFDFSATDYLVARRKRLANLTF